MNLKKFTICSITAYFLMLTPCHAEEIYIESESTSDYVSIDKNDFVEGFIEDSNGKTFFIEGKLLDGVVDDGSNFYDAETEEQDFFNQKSEFEEDEDFFGQEYEINLEEE